MKVSILKHHDEDTIGYLELPLLKRNASLQYWNAQSGLNLTSVMESDVIIILGGPLGEFNPSKEEYTVIEQCLATQTPLIGVCLGAQMIAHCLGSKIYKNPQIEIGWMGLDLKDKASLYIHPLSKEKTQVFSWHADTFTLPTESRLLASTPICENQIFSYHDRVLGFQCHLELTQASFDAWIASRTLEASKYGIQVSDLLLQAKENWQSYEDNIPLFFDQWLKSLHL